jgi:hypothetical protein
VDALHFGPQPAAFLQKYPFASARVLAQRFLASVLEIKEIIAALGAQFAVHTQTVARVAVSVEILGML